MQYSFLHVFANDATVDARELAMIEKLALRDGQIDDHERLVLGRIFGRVTSETCAPDVWSEICEFKSRYQIP